MLRILLFLLCAQHIIAQDTIPYGLLAPMPEAVSNHAVTTAKVGDTTFLYTFCGIDSTKKYSGIHLKAWKYNARSDEWSALPAVPDALGGKIAASASTVKNKVYVIGGYHVAANGDEVSSKKVHRFDPETNTWLSDGKDIPVAIDDQVQVVWRDSLIYVVTGWSNNANVPNVQIYNPSNDTWAVGTPVPNTTAYKAFGASGFCAGNQIMYAGGAAQGSNFPAANKLRKGTINPLDPTQIQWSEQTDTTAKGYRMACVMQYYPIWIGGSKVTYNYDGIAYNGSGGVAASGNLTYFQSDSLKLVSIPNVLPPVMDLRGAGLIDGNCIVVAGGMTDQQLVTKRVFQFCPAWLVDTHTPEQVKRLNLLEIVPNPAQDWFKINGFEAARVEVIDVLGQIVLSVNVQSEAWIEVRNLPKATYLVRAYTRLGEVREGRLVKK